MSYLKLAARVGASPIALRWKSPRGRVARVYTIVATMMLSITNVGRRTMNVGTGRRFAQLLATAALLMGVAALQATSLCAGSHIGRPRRRPVPATLTLHSQHTPPRISTQSGRNFQGVSVAGCPTSGVTHIPEVPPARQSSTTRLTPTIVICALAHAPPVIARTRHSRSDHALSSRHTPCLLDHCYNLALICPGSFTSRVCTPALKTMVKPEVGTT